DLRGRLGGLTMPAHVISGEHDVLVPRWKQEELAAEIPGARHTVIAACDAAGVAMVFAARRHFRH
ncbi:MAG: hypothetical protein QOC95_1804, partial [Thermoleophilaceae bacterium]|nr:hypothetical protein [Thermoleophilaceae bacterium]